MKESTKHLRHPGWELAIVLSLVWWVNEAISSSLPQKDTGDSKVRMLGSLCSQSELVFRSDPNAEDL